MRAIRVALAAAAWSASAAGQTGYFQGVTPKPADVWGFPASVTVTRSAPAGGDGTLVPSLYTHVTTDRDARSLARMGEPHDPQQSFRSRLQRRAVRPGQQVRRRADVGRRRRSAGRGGQRRAVGARDRRVHDRAFALQGARRRRSHRPRRRGGARLRPGSQGGEESAQIASRYDPATGRWGLYNGDTPVFEVNAQTGEIRVNGRPVKVEFQ